MAIDSDPTNWIETTIDDQPVVYTQNSDQTGWIITTLSPEIPAIDDSDPTAWVITTIDTGVFLSGIFLVDATDALVPIEIL